VTVVPLIATVLALVGEPPAQASGSAAVPASEQKPNRLIDTLSPYLLQHAHNPVDWYPWGPQALERARSENKPIFLSIGYSACHWCHVMEHEVFEREDVAAVLNEHFVSIKVDREERPDLDEIYMEATLQLNHGQGGWPMSVFLRPDGVPFFAATYIPRPQFLQLVEAIAKTWESDPQRIQDAAGHLSERLAGWAAGPPPADGVAPHDVVVQTAKLLADHFDPRRGGMRSDGNKFPPSMALELLLRAQRATADPALLEPVRVTLDHMARGGIYDHLGGGICRYSTDPEWLVPHFEKMLYDQALVSSVYLDGCQVFNDVHYARVARGILDYVLSDLQSPEGGFFSTRDADSEGQEGKYYIWTLDEIRQRLGPEDAALFCDYYGVSAEGNWQERFGHAPPGPKNILHVPRDPQLVASGHGLSPDEMERRLQSMRDSLLQARMKRVPPGLDDKVLTSWNGLMIASLAKAARVLDEPRYAQAAAKAADFVLTRMRKDGRLLATWRRGEARLAAYLSDYAFMIEGLLNLYEATFDPRWLSEARALAEDCRKHYYDEEGGAFFFTAHDSEALIARTKNPRDGAIPSGNSVHASNLLRLAVLFDEPRFRQQAESIFRAFGPALARTPYAYERLLCALDLYHQPPREIVIVPGQDSESAALIRCIYSGYLPNKIVAAPHPAGAAPDLPLLRNKVALEGRPTAYVCENYRCRAPVRSAEDLRALLWPAAR
jgi:uncharacterized protein YyaL (SSP411 family)